MSWLLLRLTIFSCCELLFLTAVHSLRHMKFNSVFEAPYVCSICTMENGQNSHVTKDAVKQKAMRQVLV